MPLLPAEFMAISLMIIQPHRARVVGFGFALAASASALVLALVIAQASAYVVSANPGLIDVLEHGNPFITDWGAFALAALSIFPDSPRASVAAATVAGLPHVTIAVSVFVGKLVLYTGLSYLLIRLPTLIARLRNQQSPTISRIRPKLRRLAALQRLLQRDNS